MQELLTIARGYAKRFPEGFEPYQIVAQVLEECGEVAQQVAHFEGSGVKRAKYGELNKEKLAGEIKQALGALMRLVVYYGVENELEHSIGETLMKMKEEGLIDA